jgi:hypothetical protein
MALPAVEELKQTLATSFPEILAGSYFDPSANKGKGGYLPRLQAAPGDHSKDPNYNPDGDPHANGLALDIILFASVDGERQLAENVVDLFVYYKDKMRWSAVIYNGVTTDDFGGPKPYTGKNDHSTHIHIQWSMAGVLTRGFSGAMSDDLNDLHDRWVSGSPLPNQ